MSQGCRALLLSFLVVASGEHLAWSATSAPSTGAEDGMARARYRLLREALAQSEHITPDWNPDQRDCAGFVRHLWRKAIRGRAGGWKDSRGRDAAFLTASELVAHNFDSVAREPDAAALKTGDLLVYHLPERRAEDSWHLMVVLEPPPGAPRIPLVIYHNGAHGAQAQVRKVRLTELQDSHLGAWIPRASNPRFLGVYRWKSWISHQGAAPR